MSAPAETAVSALSAPNSAANCIVCCWRRKEDNLACRVVTTPRHADHKDPQA